MNLWSLAKNHPVLLGVFMIIVIAVFYDILNGLFGKGSDDHTLDS
jgi:hypothetical protein